MAGHSISVWRGEAGMVSLIVGGGVFAMPVNLIMTRLHDRRGHGGWAPVA